LDKWVSVESRIDDRFRKRLETSPTLGHSTDSLQTIAHLYLPLVKAIISKASDQRSHELLLKLLYNIIQQYFNADLITDDYFLRVEYKTLSGIIDQLVSDSIFADFLKCYPLKPPNLLAFSLLAESQLPYAVLISRLFRKNWLKVPIVAGGSYITELITQSLDLAELFNDFDYLVAYEGESAFVSIIKSLTNRCPVDHPNVLEQSSIRVLQRPHLEPIGSLPPPDFGGLDLNVYLTSDISLPVFSSKGCSWGKCKFCSQNSNAYREKSVKAFVLELQYVMDSTGISHFQFTDENIRPTRLREISKEILKQKLSIRWFIQVRFEREFDYSILKLMKEAGCYAIEFGLESGCKKTLERINKGIDLRDVERVLELCANLEYEVILNCIVGFPEEKSEDAEQTVSFIESIIQRLPTIKLKCNTQVFKLYPNSRYAKNSGLIYEIFPLSTAANWDVPAWVHKFTKKHGNNILFTGVNYSTKNETKDISPPTKREPIATLTPNCYVLDNIKYDLLSNELADLPCSYIAIAKPEMALPRVFRINDVMAYLVELLKNGPRNLFLLRSDFFKKFQSSSREDVFSAFRDGIVRLNDIGAVTVS
jgi:hypothetical protein